MECTYMHDGFAMDTDIFTESVDKTKPWTGENLTVDDDDEFEGGLAKTVAVSAVIGTVAFFGFKYLNNKKQWNQQQHLQ